MFMRTTPSGGSERPAVERLERPEMRCGSGEGERRSPGRIEAALRAAVGPGKGKQRGGEIEPSERKIEAEQANDASASSKRGALRVWER
jgi:hypothetical protein